MLLRLRYSIGMELDSELVLDDSDDCEAVEIGPPARVRSGVDWDLETQADELLRQSRVGITKVSDKQDFLTNDQLERRRCREVYNRNGIPDAHLYSGLYRRAWNPHAGTRPTKSSQYQEQ